LDTTNGRQFLKCEYNRDGDSYRSPFSNKYFPEPTDEPIYPNPELLQMEQKANDVFYRYATLYFDQAVTSVYFFDTDYEGFGACFLVKKEILGEKGIKEGSWDSIHVVKVS
jgi:capping protein (actin filament) muscle Z-line, beta